MNGSVLDAARPSLKRDVVTTLGSARQVSLCAAGQDGFHESNDYPRFCDVHGAFTIRGKSCRGRRHGSYYFEDLSEATSLLAMDQFILVCQRNSSKEA